MIYAITTSCLVFPHCLPPSHMKNLWPFMVYQIVLYCISDVTNSIYRRIKTKHTTQDDNKYLEQSIIVKYRKPPVLLSSFLRAFCLLLWTPHKELIYHRLLSVVPVFAFKRLTYPKTLNLFLRIESRMVWHYQKLTTELQHWKGEKSRRGDRIETVWPSAL